MAHGVLSDTNKGGTSTITVQGCVHQSETLGTKGALCKGYPCESNSRESNSSGNSCNVNRKRVESDLIQPSLRRSGESRQQGRGLSGSKAFSREIETDMLFCVGHIENDQYRFILVTAKVREDIGIVLIEADVVSV